ncbi:hypothetical protein QYM36_011810 [Artemia franciscana]|uniref:Reverse transcriptase domain-containing protein n=1 Tax=Artemia franciscana TaxID=6661 RepID=A0AA88KWV5_ARTSF|nr:hypothetical protein QYM36_011810 [Artemia franciscana]
MVMVEKKDGGVRLCIDPVDLNKAIKRPYYPVPSFEDAVAELDGAAVFSRLDARSGYWILPLSTRSSYYTTFSTIYGRYRWKRYPFGLVSAQDEFQRKMEEAFEGLEGIRILVDDILVYGKNREEHDQRLSAVLRRARKKRIRFNSEKCEFSKDKGKYFGHIISRDGIKPDPEKIRAIQDMPSPQSKEELQTLLGMLNFLSKYIPDLSSKNKPLRDLTKATDFRWETDHEASMKEIKSCISENLAFFDHKCKVVELKVDASKHGLGAELSSNGKIVGFASRALSTTEQNYSQLEKELYAIVFGCKHFHHYIYGRKTIVTTDHRPLETILSRPLHMAPARLQRMMIQIQPYDIEVHYSPGSDIPVPDALSRLHLPDVDTKMQNDIEVFVHTVMKSLPVSDSKLDEIRRETEKDTQLKAVKELILKGWPGTRQSSKEQERQKRYHDKTAKPLREPQLEDQVFIQKKTNGPWTKAKIISCHENPRSYVVETEDGSRLRRNRVHISRHSFPVAKEEVRIQPTSQDKSNDISHPILTESPQPIRTDIETSPRNVPLPREEDEPSDPPLVAPTIVPTPENAAPDCPATGTKSPTTTSKVMPHTRSGRVEFLVDLAFISYLTGGLLAHGNRLAMKFLLPWTYLIGVFVTARCDIIAPRLDIPQGSSYHGLISEDSFEVKVTPKIKTIDGGSICGFRITKKHHGEAPFELVIANQETGEADLRARRPLNCEKRKSYSFDFVAVACTGAASQNATVHITVTDVNEFSPKFTAPAYIAEVDEGRLYESVIQVEAEDEDCSEKFSDICKYAILNEEEPFAIDDEGVIRTTIPLSHDDSHNYILKVVAYDCGMKMSDPVLVTIKVNRVCKLGWQDVPERISYSPGSGRKSLFPDTKFDLCNVPCTAKDIQSRISLAASHLGKKCDRDTYSVTDQRKLCEKVDCDTRKSFIDKNYLFSATRNTRLLYVWMMRHFDHKHKLRGPLGPEA